MHVAITGASSGIGEALAKEMAAHGHDVTLVARRRELLDALAKSLPTKSYVHAADLADLAQATSFIAPAEAALGPIDILVNNAGVQIVRPFEHTDPLEGERLIAVDLLAPLRITRAVLPGMLARKAGTIVDIASLAAIAPTPGMLYYNAAKAGLAAASESLRGELRLSGVHVVTVYPGPVKTAMADAAVAKYEKAPGLPTGDTATLARRIRLAIERRKARVIYPRVYGVARHFPNTTRAVLDRFTPRPKDE